MIPGVPYNGEFRRIEALPRRNWEDYDFNIQSLFAKDGCPIKLWPAQSAALWEIYQYHGALLPIGVGQGKALISLLAPVAMDAKRPLLIVPASLREQTIKYVIPKWDPYFKMHPRLKVIGYSELSLEENANLLYALKPDLIILDECHYVARPESGRTRRLTRYFKENLQCRCVALSGTIMHRSLQDFAHISYWCLGQGSPLPTRWQDLTTWAGALDAGIPEESRIPAGALNRFRNPGESVRQGFRRRFVQSTGVVATREKDLAMSLEIYMMKNLYIPSDVQKVIKKVRDTWETPNGDLILEALHFWRIIRQLALGFWYRWDPLPPREWMDARREWKKEAKYAIYKRRSLKLDTELQVKKYVESGKCSDKGQDRDLGQAYHDWFKIKDTFKPNRVIEWITRQWIIENQAAKKMEQGIIWVEHPEYGKELAHYLQIPYFGQGDDGIITTEKSKIIASIKAHGEGKNLQRYSNNLVVSPPTSGRTWEQILGRTHRAGQKADVVTCSFFAHVPELRLSFRQAREDARVIENTTSNRQKLNYANIVEV
jgi:hypothetical protein